MIIRKYFHLTILFALSLASLIYSQCTYNSATQTWDCPSGSNNLATAIQNSAQDDIIRLHTGTYNIAAETNITDRGLKIIGEGTEQTRINFTGGFHGLVVQEERVELRGFELTRSYANHTGIDPSGSGVGILLMSAFCTIDNVQVGSWWTGIGIRDNKWCHRIKNCRIEGNTYGLQIINDGGSGEANDLIIEANEFEVNARFGIWARMPGWNTRIINNMFGQNGRSAICIEAAYKITISGNYFESNEWQVVADGNEDQTQDAHILFQEVAGVSNSQIRHISLYDNNFGLHHQGNVVTRYSVTTTTTKKSGGASFSAVRPWRFVNCPLYNTSSLTGTKLMYDNTNVYVPYNHDTNPANLDNCFCKVISTCF